MISFQLSNAFDDEHSNSIIILLYTPTTNPYRSMKFSTATLFLFLGSASAAREWTLDKPTLTVSCNLITVLIVDYVRMSSTIGFSVGYFCDLVPRKKERERSFFFSLLFVVSSIITYRAYVCCNCFASVLLSLSMDRVDPPEGWPRS